MQPVDDLIDHLQHVAGMHALTLKHRTVHAHNGTRLQLRRYLGLMVAIKDQTNTGRLWHPTTGATN